MTVKEFLDILETARTVPNYYNNKYPYNCGYYDGTRFSFDCWNLIKAILGGWHAEYTKGYYVSPKDFPTGDCTGEGLLRQCSNCSKDFSKLKTPGTYLYLSDHPHAGIYVGDRTIDGKTYNVIECTAAWDGGVQYSYVDKTGGRFQYKGGSKVYAWTDYGLLPYVDYKTSVAQPSANGTISKDYDHLSGNELIKAIAPKFQADSKKTGILASVSMAQCILESGWLKTQLAQNANNLFGMKAKISNNTWAGSVWKGEVYTKKTKEWKNFRYVEVKANFRAYSSIEESIADHSAYLIGAMNGENKRYPDIDKICDYKKAVQVIKDGGYATSPTYVEKLCSIIEKWQLTRYDDTKIQNGNPPKPLPFLVKVPIKNLNIRKGPGTDYSTIGKNTGIGTFTIVEFAEGEGSKKGWGKLKSGIGWISLDYVIIRG